MKIMVMTPHLSGKGGTETVLGKFVNGLQAKENYNIRLIINGGSDDQDWVEEISSKVKKNIFSFHNNFLKLLYACYTFLFSHDDALILIDTRLILIARIVKKLFLKKYKIISWIHFSIFNSTSVKVKYLKYADYHFSISSGISKQIESLNVEKKSIFTIYNPVTKTDYKVSRTVQGDFKRFVYVGRIQFNHQKNLKLMLDTLATLNSNWKLDVYGDGEDLEKCKEYANSLGIGKYIKWWGWVNNPWAEITSADALLLSSNYEGFPMILLEALAHGLPCVSADCPTGPEDVIKDGINGFLFRKEDQSSMRSAVSKILSNEFSQTTDVVKNSIAEFYDDQYFSNVDHILKKIQKSK